MTYRDLKEKEVINCCDGKKLGFITDLELDSFTGQICSLIVVETGSFLSCLCNSRKRVISYSDIVKIGPDVIVVSYKDHKKNSGCKI